MQRPLKKEKNEKMTISAIKKRHDIAGNDYQPYVQWKPIDKYFDNQ